VPGAAGTFEAVDVPGLAVPDRHQRLPGPARQSAARSPRPGGEVLWLQPYPDRLLDEFCPAGDAESRPAAVARETSSWRTPARRVHHRAAPGPIPCDQTLAANHSVADHRTTRATRSGARTVPGVAGSARPPSRDCRGTDAGERRRVTREEPFRRSVAVPRSARASTRTTSRLVVHRPGRRQCFMPAKPSW